MSCLPATWNDASKRKSTDSDAVHEQAAKRARKRFEFQSTEQHSESAWDLLRRLQGHLHDTERAQHKATDLTIEASVMLSSVPFLEHLAQIDDSMAQHDVPVVTRAYEETYMRGRMHDKEAECAMGPQCECMMLDSRARFVGVQFEIPSTTGEMGNNLCIFCLRKITLLLFYEALLKGMPIAKPIQKYGNITGQPNEYHPSAMLMCPKNGPIHCMPLPIVAHQRSTLRVEVLGGVHYVRQQGVYMENFCPAPS